MNPTVLTEVRGDVLVITLNRPEAKNSINHELAVALARAFELLDETAGVRAGVLTGAGTDFCAGMDLKAFASGAPLPEVNGKGLAGLGKSAPRKPLVAAVEGHAVAGGFELVLSCDLIVAAENARFGLPEVKRGLIAAGGGIVRLARMVPRNLAMGLLLTGEVLEVEEMRGFGLLNEVTPLGTTVDAAVDLARRISANAPRAVEETKSLFLAAGDLSTAAAFDLVDRATPGILGSADALEGATAFAEKREPRWTGR
ncbi:crotonase/enoyl-CoA hydratase family protein [Dietzia kunjamensis]|uniref:crotonase/enoyl-CoA hydratase family protein n=1 Tax=Dietzia kunjamensis TaxID=322509 RepID=UPI003366B0A9